MCEMRDKHVAAIVGALAAAYPGWPHYLCANCTVRGGLRTILELQR